MLCDPADMSQVKGSPSSSSLCSRSVPCLGEYLPHLPILRYPLPDGTLLVVVKFVSPLFRRPSSRSLPFVRFPGRSVHRLSRFLQTCPAQVRFRLPTCSITSVTFVFSLTQMFVFCPGMGNLTYYLPSLFVRLLAYSLLG